MKTIILKIREKIKNNKKTSICLLCLGALFFFIMALIIDLAMVVGIMLSLSLKPSFKIDTIKFLEPGKIHGEHVRLSYQGKKIIDAPKVEIEYELKGQPMRWLKKITVIDPDIVIERKDNSVNIVEAFATGSSGKSGTGVPIGIIESVKGTVLYRDFSYEFPIEKKLYDVDGFVSFDQEKGIDLLFAGSNGEEKVAYSFSNYDYDYWMNIKTENVLMTTNLLQYGYYYEPIQYIGGKIDLDLTISPEGLIGSADVKDAIVEYSDFSEKAENINGKVQFLGKEIKIDADFDLFGQRKKYTLDYHFHRGLDMKIILGEMNFNEIRHYKLLEDLGTEFKGLLFQNMLVNLTLDEKNIFAVNVTYDIEDMILKGVSLENNSGSIRYSQDTVTFNFITSDFRVGNFHRKIKIDGILNSGQLDIEYLVGDFSGEGILYLNENSLDFENRKGFIGLKGNFDYGSKILQINELDGSKDKFQLIYDFTKDEFVKFSGNFQLNILDLGTLKVWGIGEGNEFYFDKVEFYQNENLVLTGAGELDVNTLYYKFSFDSENFNYKYSMGEKELELLFSSSGDITGFGNKFKLDLDGTIENLTFDDFKFNGLKYNLRIAENILEINNLSNGYLSFSGKYFLETNTLKGKYKIENLTQELFSMSKLRFDIIQAEGDIAGTIHDIQIKFKVDESKFYPFLENDEYITLKGEGDFKDKVLVLKNILLNESSKAAGKYDFTTSKYEFKADLNEGNLPKYFQERNLKYRVAGSIEGSGQEKKIEAKSRLRIESLYFKGQMIGELDGDISYSAENFTEGILNINSLNFSRDHYEILKLYGNIDFKTGKLDIKTSDRDIDVQKIMHDENIRGFFNLSGKIAGTMKKPDYSLRVNSQKLFLENVEFTNILADITGNQSEINLNELTFNYLGNRLNSKGFYKFNSSEYLLNINSGEIELTFLNFLLEKRGIKGIRGDAEMNISLSSDGNSGIFRGKDIKFDIPDSGIKGEEITFQFKLDKRKILIERFTGKVNNGDANINGYLELPSLVEMRKNPYFYESLDYNLDISLLNFFYESKSYYDFTLDSALNISENKISGNIDFLKGNLEAIPGIGDGFSILGIIKKIIFSAIPMITKTDKNIDREYSVETRFKDSVAVDLDFKIVDGIKVDIPSIWNILEDVSGEIKGGGKLSGVGNRINFMGQFEWEEGEFVLGDNDYNVLTGRIVFNNPNEYFPDINPVLTLETFSPLDNIEISLNGELKSLNFRIKTKDEHSSGTLASLFKNEMNYSEENQRLGPSITVLKGILGAQITNSVLGPVSRTIKKMFGLSKLRVTADITDNFNQYIENEEAQTDETNFNFGIKIVAEDSIYKEKFFAVADARLTSTQENKTDRTLYSGYNSFDRYRAGLEYRYEPGKTIGIGVENKGAEDFAVDGHKINKGKLNYYIDFKIEKKYDSLIEIYRGFIQSIFK